jgi:hypothetical protein
MSHALGENICNKICLNKKIYNKTEIFKMAASRFVEVTGKEINELMKFSTKKHKRFDV